MSRPVMMKILDLRNRSHFAENYLEPALEKGFIEMTIPDKPKSKNQKYRLTSKGEKLKKQLQDEHQ
jgi:ATP-dependent DNA helicase RecG